MTRHQTLINGALRRSLLRVEHRAFFHARSRFERLFLADAVSVVSRFLQLLRLLEIAELVVRD